MAQLQLETLRDLVGGPIFTRHDDGYDAEVLAWNLSVVQHPDVVIGASSTEDVVAGVRFAHSTASRVTVQCTGHGAHVPITSGVLITTSRLEKLDIDPQTRIATIGAGVRWQRVIDEAWRHGLVPISGPSTSVGVVGYLLGGGLGPLSRSHGFSSDYLRGVTVVTGEGERVEANADSNPDLFWALRGGKIGLGIVTEVRLELVEMTTLYAGSLLFDTEHIEQVLRGWIDYTATAPDDVTTSIAIMRLPDLDVVPPPVRGRTLASIRFAYPGDSAEGARLAGPLRALAPVYLDSLAEMATTDIPLIHGDPTEPSPSFTRGGMLDSADQRLATAVLAHVGAGSRVPLIVFELRHLGGATHVDVAGGSAVGGRDASYTVAAIGAPDPALFDTVLPAVIDPLFDDLAPWLSTITNVNFLTRLDSRHRLASAWPANILDRLTEVRRRYDPDGTVAPPAFATASSSASSTAD